MEKDYEREVCSLDQESTEKLSQISVIKKRLDEIYKDDENFCKIFVKFFRLLILKKENINMRN